MGPETKEKQTHREELWWQRLAGRALQQLVIYGLPHPPPHKAKGSKILASWLGLSSALPLFPQLHHQEGPEAVRRPQTAVGPEVHEEPEHQVEEGLHCGQGNESPNACPETLCQQHLHLTTALNSELGPGEPAVIGEKLMFLFLSIILGAFPRQEGLLLGVSNSSKHPGSLAFSELEEKIPEGGSGSRLFSS